MAECGQCIVRADSDARNSTIGENEDGIDRVDVILNLCCDTLLVNFVLLKTASIRQPRCVEDVNLGKWSNLLANFSKARAYLYAVVATKRVMASRIGLTFLVGATRFVFVIKDVKIVVVDVVSEKNIGDELQD